MSMMMQAGAIRPMSSEDRPPVKTAQTFWGDGGSVQYNLDTRTQTLTNAILNLADYQSDADENNTVYGIETFRNLKLVLVGENKIISTAEQFTEDKE